MDFREKYIPKTWFVVLLHGQEKEVRVGIFSVCSSQPIRSWEGKQVNGFICLTNLVGSSGKLLATAVCFLSELS